MAVRQTGQRVHGIQLWVALPAEHEEMAPEFFHHPQPSIPAVDLPGVHVRILAGSAYGKTSPVKVLSPLFYGEARLDAGAELELPSDHAERAAYVATGAVSCGCEVVADPKLLVFRAGQRAVLRATSDACVILLAGDPLESERHIFWNFVSSSPERIERAKHDWAERRFPSVPGDEQEFFPLPAY